MTTPQPAPGAFDPKQPFTRAEARAAGVTDDALQTSAYQRLFYNTYLCSTVAATTAVRARAALSKLGDTGHASHHTAAELWGLPIRPDGLVHVTAAKLSGRTRSRGIFTHQPLSIPGRTAVRHGVRVSVPAQLFCELAAIGYNLVELVVIGDAMLKAELVTRKALNQIVASMSGAGARLARRALGFVRAGVDSAMESRLRMLLVLAGLAEPKVNHILRKFDGSWDRRFDMCYLELKLIIEYDGEQHGELVHRDSDLHRREELERLGYKIVAVTSLGIYRDPGLTLRRVADAIRERGGHAPRRFQPEWRVHFRSSSSTQT